MPINLTITEQDKRFLKKCWYYFQHFIQYGYLTTVSILFVYRTSIPECGYTNYFYSCHYYSYSIAKIFGYTVVGLLMIYWHKNTKK